MGVEHRPEDLLKGRKRLLEQGLRDLSPGVKENVRQLLEAWEGDASEVKLSQLVGREKAQRLIRDLRLRED